MKGGWTAFQVRVAMAARSGLPSSSAVRVTFFQATDAPALVRCHVDKEPRRLRLKSWKTKYVMYKSGTPLAEESVDGESSSILFSLGLTGMVLLSQFGSKENLFHTQVCQQRLRVFEVA